MKCIINTYAVANNIIMWEVDRKKGIDKCWPKIEATVSNFNIFITV